MSVCVRIFLTVLMMMVRVGIEPRLKLQYDHTAHTILVSLISKCCINKIQTGEKMLRKNAKEIHRIFIRFLTEVMDRTASEKCFHTNRTEPNR